MIRRTSLLLAAPILAAGLLAGCDLPAGSPKILGPDQVPNDTFEDAPAVRVPTVINGTVDANDTDDWYRLTPPSQTSELYVTCTGNVFVNRAINVNSTDVQADEQNEECDGQPIDIGPVHPDTEDLLGAGYFDESAAISPYLFTVRYGPVVEEH